MNKTAIGGTALILSILLGGCTLIAQPADIKTEDPRQIITGKILVSGDRVTITSNGKVIEITSRKLDLKQYNGKDVTIFGEYSGTTLYVDDVKEIMY